jgi:RND family efflux transporter MFP subunit
MWMGRSSTLVLLLSGCGVAYPDIEMDRTPRVSVAEVRPLVGGTRRTVLSTAEPEDDAWMATLRPGRVRAVPVAVGDPVAAGDPLLELEADEARANLRLAEAGVAEARAVVDDAEQQKVRVEALGDGATAAQLQGVTTGVLRAEAALARALAQRDLARTELGHHTLRAPFDGVVSSVEVAVGDTVAAGTPGVRVVSPDRVEVEVGLLADEVMAARAGTVDFTLRWGVTEVVAGLGSVAAAADPRTRTWKTLLTADAANLPLGAPVEVVLSLTRGPDGLVVPPTALYDDQVWLVVDGVAQRRAVDVVGEGPEGLFVRGLAEGDAVVVFGATELSDGASVRVLEATP